MAQPAECLRISVEGEIIKTEDSVRRLTVAVTAAARAHEASFNDVLLLMLLLAAGSLGYVFP